MNRPRSPTNLVVVSNVLTFIQHGKVSSHLDLSLSRVALLVPLLDIVALIHLSVIAGVIKGVEEHLSDFFVHLCLSPKEQAGLESLLLSPLADLQDRLSPGFGLQLPHP